MKWIHTKDEIIRVEEEEDGLFRSLFFLAWDTFDRIRAVKKKQRLADPNYVKPPTFHEKVQHIRETKDLSPKMSYLLLIVLCTFLFLYAHVWSVMLSFSLMLIAIIREEYNGQKQIRKEI